MNTSDTEVQAEGAPGLTPLVLTALARDTLLDHLTRGDARHALRLLALSLARITGGPCWVQAADANGQPLWLEGSPAAPAAAATTPAMAVQFAGRLVGRLWLFDGQGGAVQQAPLDPLWPTLCALMQMAAPTGPVPRGVQAPRLHSDVIRAALRGADTFVWEWLLDNDWLSDVDEGLHMLGYAPGSVGHTQNDWNQLIHPEDLAANHDCYLRHERGETPTYEHTYRLRAANGLWRWTTERGRIIERHADGRARRMVGTQTDVTNPLQRDAAAQQATSRLSRIASSVPWVLFQYLQQTGDAGDASARHPPGDRFLYVSPRCSDVLGVPSAALTASAKAFDELILPQDRPLRHGLGQVAADNAAITELRIRRPNDGAVRWLRITSTRQGPADGHDPGLPGSRALGEPEGGVLWHGSIEDITEQREMARLNEAAAAAQAANDAKTRFLAHMSHELRTPLNAVLGFTQLLELDRSDPATEGQRRRLKMIRDAGEHLLRMITDLLDLTRIEAGQLSLRLEVMPLRNLAEQALQMVQAQADVAQVQLSLQAVEELWLQGDRTRVQQVLLNLLGNAIKYNRPGGHVVLRLQRGAPAQVQITVTDTGVGIAEADLAQVFEPFYRGHQASGKIEGAGIGLAVTRALVQLMGGQIDVRSTPGSGSEFCVRWAQAAAPEPALMSNGLDHGAPP